MQTEVSLGKEDLQSPSVCCLYALSIEFEYHFLIYYTLLPCLKPNGEIEDLHPFISCPRPTRQSLFWKLSLGSIGQETRH